MKAIVFDQPGDESQLYLAEVADPAPAPEAVLLHVAATALNRADLLQREGKYPVPPGANPILGLEVAGTVIEVGSTVTGFEVGDNVCALVNGGGYAQQIAVDHRMLLKLPEKLSFTKAAAIPEVFLTAYQALYWIARIQASETVLIHAGASGVGTAAIQLVRLAGGVPIVTASGHKHAALEELGAARCIDYRAEDFAEAVLDATDGRGADVILDFVGGPYLAQNLQCSAVDARIVSLAALGGARVADFSMAPFLRKRIQLTGTTMRSRTDEYRRRLTADFRRDIWPHFADGSLQAVVDTIYDWEEVAAAHRYMASNANVGKIVMTIGLD
ncbi:putative PIG3 family NAD(P)H quinone oxidoreductase [Lewinella marina]|uniref:NADPH:quinone oxidoreductase n=1 Tax=Neolewinella marina TaxID=438751 RepID=A0A2G0CEY3_9BACT|nr:NAD(P)H-quinone oxidoreductase [Neolewinella marina]NJB85809.1 putative PIG3 family NAD(P)H quinone oxidoreductase [Neolewinella marina]PHK98522.1 NADPH:quinone oxidoreductase [Neolewinella marina]